jgi:hypothetical protein
MRRIAIIIGDGVSGGERLPGVAADHSTLAEFLCSDAGGAWEEDELVHLNKALSARDLTQALKAGARCDYALVTFSGHGYIDGKSKDTMICVGPGVEVADGDLLTGAARQLAILDSCRKVVSGEALGKSERISFGRFGEATQAARYRRSCRALYDRLVADADEGVSFVFACGAGQSAGDRPSGGMFLQSLINWSSNWASEAKVPGREAMKYVSIPNAVQGAAQALAQRRSPQQPVAALGRRREHFPFAVA